MTFGTHVTSVGVTDVAYGGGIYEPIIATIG